MSHPTTRLDPAIHQPARLGILTSAAETKRIDFVSLATYWTSPTATSRGTSRRSRRPDIEKTFDGRKPRTSISATEAGRKALKEEIAALREIIGSVDGQSAIGGVPGSAPLAGT